MQRVQPGKYRHYKGNSYLVLGTARHSETLEELVVYIPLYDNDLASLWVRPAAMFLEEVEVNEKRVPRFARIDEQDTGSGPLGGRNS